VVDVGSSAAVATSCGAVPVSHLANVEALVQRAAAEAATRCAGSAASGGAGGGQMMDHHEQQQQQQQLHCSCIDQRQPSSSLPRGAPPSYAASTAATAVSAERCSLASVKG